MKNKIILLTILCLLAVGCGDDTSKKNINQYQNDKEEITIQKVTCEEKDNLLKEGAILIDVRTEEEYKENHIDKAINISNTEISEKIEEKVPDKNKKIIVYCQSGIRSNNAATALITMGYTQVYDLGSINNCKS